MIDKKLNNDDNYSEPIRKTVANATQFYSCGYFAI